MKISMFRKIDISEQSITENYPGVLDILLRDQTSKKNIIWATSNYEHFGSSYLESKQIKSDLITSINGDVIMPKGSKRPNI